MTNAAQQRLQALLRNLFQFEDADLDFGIYRIMRQKRESVQAFLDGLPERMGVILQSLSAGQQQTAQSELAQLRQQVLDSFGANALEEDGSIGATYRETPLAKRYQALREQSAAAQQQALDETSVYNHLVAFFERYYDNGDFIAQRRYGSDDAYAVPYNGEETLLYYANNDQYYVKTGERFSAYQFTVDASGGPYSVRFRLDGAAVAQNNNKSERAFFVLSFDDPVRYDAAAKLLTVTFVYRPLAAGEGEDGLNAAKQQERLFEEAIRRILDSDAPPALAQKLQEPREGEETPLLLWHLRRYGRRRTSDFFVHKNLERFLERELETYIKQNVMDFLALASMRTADLDREVRRLRAVREIGMAVIAFLAQIEDFQKRLFEKPKFVVRSDYLVTLDLVPRELYEQIAANERQIAAWRALYRLPALDHVSATTLEELPGLMLDTRLHDQAITDAVLAAIPNLDAATSGVLINGENWQALRLLREHGRGTVKCIYIDPPYNTGGDGFLYKDRYQHSSWLAMMYDRLLLARDLLTEDGVVFISIDDNEQTNLKLLADQVFGSDNFVANVIWQKVFAPKNTAQHFSDDHEYVLVYAKDKMKWRPSLLERSEEAEKRYSNADNDPRGVWSSGDLTARNYYSEGKYEVQSPNGTVFTPPSGRYWVVSKANFEKLDADKRIWWGKGGGNMPRLKRFRSDVKEGVVPQTLWLHNDVGNTQEAKKELLSVITFERSEDVLNTVKPTGLIRRVLQIGTSAEREDVIIDFFAGSGTTGDAVIKQNREDGGRRKFVLAEMGNYFDTMVVPRVIKACWGDEWKDGVAGTPAGGSHVIRVERLESYEDALNNIEFDEALHQHVLDLFDERGREEYILRYQLDYEAKGSQSLLNIKHLRNPFQYALAISEGEGSPERTVVDIPATFAYLAGLRVTRQQALSDEGRRYLVQRGTLPDGSAAVVVWRDLDGTDLRRDEEFIKANIPLEGAKLFFNTDAYLPGEPVELLFLARMK